MATGYSTEKVTELIADTRDHAANMRRVWGDDPEVRDDSRLFDRLADALEQSQAELRQERERAEQAAAELADVFRVDIPSLRERAVEASHAAGRHKSDAALYEAALSRAEETIEKFNQLRLKLNADPDYLVTKASLGRRIHALLTEYSRECSIE